MAYLLVVSSIFFSLSQTFYNMHLFSTFVFYYFENIIHMYFFNDGWWICHFLLSDGPSVVKLRLQGKTLSAGKSHQIKCEAIGAKPQATITWWVGGKQVLHKRSLSRRKKCINSSYYSILQDFFLIRLAEHHIWEDLNPWSTIIV